MDYVGLVIGFEDADLDEGRSAVGSDEHREVALVGACDGSNCVVDGMADVVVGDSVFVSTTRISTVTTLVVVSDGGNRYTTNGHARQRQPAVAWHPFGIRHDDRFRPPPDIRFRAHVLALVADLVRAAMRLQPSGWAFVDMRCRVEETGIQR